MKRPTQEERYQKEWATQRWRQVARPQEYQPQEVYVQQIAEQEELKKVQFLIQKNMKTMEIRLPLIKSKIETTPELHKYREALAQYEEYIRNPTLIRSCHKYKLIELVAFTRKIEQIIESSKKIPIDVVDDFKKKMAELLKTVAKLESSKEAESTSVITLSDLKDQRIKVDDFFKGQNHIKIDNSFENCLKQLVFPRQDTPPQGFVTIKREHVIDSIGAYNKKYETERTSFDDQLDADSSQGDEFTNHVSVSQPQMLEDFKRIHEGYVIQSGNSKHNKFLKIKVSKKQMPELGEIVILVDANSHYIFVKESKYFKEVLEEIDRQNSRDLYHIVQCWYQTLYAKCKMNTAP